MWHLLLLRQGSSQLEHLVHLQCALWRSMHSHAVWLLLCPKAVTSLSVICVNMHVQVTGRTALELGTLHDTLATMPVSTVRVAPATQGTHAWAGGWGG